MTGCAWHTPSSVTSAIVPHALVRPPGPLLADGLVTHIDRTPIDLRLAVAQWQAYVDALHDHGWTTSAVEPADDCADAVFVEDAMVVFDRLCVITRPGAVSRQPEVRGAEAAAVAAGLEIHRIVEPGTLDGGDVLKVDRVVYVGVGGRTNPPAVAQLAQILAPRGWEVRPVPVASRAAPQVGRDRIARWHGGRVRRPRRRPVGVRAIPRRPRAGRRPRRAARRRPAVDVRRRTRRRRPCTGRWVTT